MRNPTLLFILASYSSFLTAQVVPDWTRESVFDTYHYSEFAYHQSYLVAKRRCGGFDVLDVRNTDAAPTLIGQVTDAPAFLEIQSFDGVLYGLAGNAVYLIDIDEPAKPSVMHLVTLPTEQTMLNLTKHGDRLFVGNFDLYTRQDLALFVLDPVTYEPTAISFSGADTHFAAGLVFYNDLIAVTNFQYLYVYRFNGEDQASLLSQHTAPLGVNNVAVFGDALVVQYHNDLVAHDLTQPETLPELSRVNYQNEVGVWVREGDYLIMNSQRFPAIWSYADPRNPEFVQHTGILGGEDSYLDLERNLMVNLQPTSIEYQPFRKGGDARRFSFTDAFLGMRGAALNGDRLAVNLYGELALFSLAIPGQPRFLSQFSVYRFINHMHWSGDYLILVATEFEIPTLWIYDMRDPARPEMVFTAGLDGYAVNGSLVWIDVFGLFWVLDLGNPQEVATLAQLDVNDAEPVFGRRAVVNQDAVLVFGPGGRTLYDIVDGTLVQSVTSPEVLPEGALIRRDHVLFVHGETSLISYDISDLSAPVELDRLTHLPSQRTLADPETFFGDFLALRTEEGTAWVDVADPTDLALARLDVSEALAAVEDETAIFYPGCDGLFEVRALSTCAPPVITQQPIGSYVCDTESYSLHVTATGPDVTYQWRTNQGFIVGATEPTLDLGVVGHDNAGVYTCIVSNGCQVILSESATVLPTICELSRAFQTWQTSDTFCGVQNPTVLDFAAAVSGDGCP